MGKHKFYAVARGQIPGIYTSWDECKEQVDGFPNSKYKGFPTREQAEEYMAEHCGHDHTSPKRLRTDGPDGPGGNGASSSSVNRDVTIDSHGQGPSVGEASPPNEVAPEPLVYARIDGMEKTVCKFNDIRAGQIFKTFSTEEDAWKYKFSNKILIEQVISEGHDRRDIDYRPRDYQLP